MRVLETEWTAKKNFSFSVDLYKITILLNLTGLLKNKGFSLIRITIVYRLVYRLYIG